MLSAALLLFTAVSIPEPTHVAGLFQCDRDTGPAGDTGCIEPDILNPSGIDRYNYSAPQYATCITDAYMQQVSKGKQKCVDRTRTYCYYQCMLEVHGKENGTVTPDCVCDPDNTTVLPNVAGLGPQCFSPDGSDCGWYRDCLEKRYDCRNSLAASSAVSYAEMFCTVFLERSQTLSTDGQRWMDQARKCLQVQLVPLLRPFEQVTCSDVKQRTIQSQAACYLQPFVDVLSMCDLPSADFWRVFWAIKGAFAASFKESLVGMLKIADGCASSQSGTTDRNLNRLVDGMTQTAIGISLTFESIRNPHDQQSPARNTWEGETDEEMYHHGLAEATATQMAEQLEWEERGVTWFAYGKVTGNDILVANILLADVQAFELDSETKASRPNLTEMVEQAAQAFEEGEIIIKLNGTQVQVETFKACSDVRCDDVYLNVTALRVSSPSSSACSDVQAAVVFHIVLAVAFAKIICDI